MSLPRPLVERFARHLADVRDEVVALEAAVAGGEDRWKELRVIAHKLAGTSAAYGFPAVGEAARALEAAILDDADRASTPAARVGDLRAALAASAGAASP